MVEQRKLFKTKLCVLYQKGHCNRLTCSFAHGDAELRRFSSGSFNGRRDYRGSDFRNRLDRRHSPRRRYSPSRDEEGRHTLRGYSRSSSPGKRSEKKRHKRQQLDGQSDFSGSGKISDGTEDQMRDRKLTPSDSKGVLREQLRQVQSDIDVLNSHKSELQTYLEERVQEVDCLTSRIQELEMQLGQEREDCKRITSKIKKFVKAHNRYSGLQDELKRSHDRLQKMADQLTSDATRLGVNEDDSSINILSEGNITGNQKLSPPNELQNIASPKKKRLRVIAETAEELKSANLMKGEGSPTGVTRLVKHSRWNAQHAQFNNTRDEPVDYYGTIDHRTVANEAIPKRGKIVFTNVPSAEKFKGSEPALVPPTGMAAHAADEVVEAIEMEEDPEAFETDSAAVEKGATYGMQGLPFALPPPPPPPLPQHLYSQYKGEDLNEALEALEDEMVEVDVV